MMNDKAKLRKSWSCDEAMYKEVEAAAKKLDMTVSQYLRLCVRKGLEIFDLVAWENDDD